MDIEEVRKRKGEAEGEEDVIASWFVGDKDIGVTKISLEPYRWDNT